MGAEVWYMCSFDEIHLEAIPGGDLFECFDDKLQRGVMCMDKGQLIRVLFFPRSSASIVLDVRGRV